MTGFRSPAPLDVHVHAVATPLISAAWSRASVPWTPLQHLRARGSRCQGAGAPWRGSIVSDRLRGAKPIEGEDTYRGVLASCRGGDKYIERWTAGQITMVPLS